MTMIPNLKKKKPVKNQNKAFPYLYFLPALEGDLICEKIVSQTSNSHVGTLTSLPVTHPSPLASRIC